MQISVRLLWTPQSDIMKQRSHVREFVSRLAFTFLLKNSANNNRHPGTVITQGTPPKSNSGTEYVG